MRLAIAAEQLAIHRAKLAEYEEDQRVERGPGAAGPGHRTAERWRGETVRMGLLYERAAVDFWAGVAGSAGPADAATARARAEDDGARVTRELIGVMVDKSLGEVWPSGDARIVRCERCRLVFWASLGKHMRFPRRAQIRRGVAQW